ncbi:hypothetical protein CF326_g5325 [Tilletia indica]|nr:hypothetical protein CF326_g5325 [Tilletia indica]
MNQSERRHRDRQVTCYCFRRCTRHGGAPREVIARTRDAHLAEDESTLAAAQLQGIVPPSALKEAITNNRCYITAEAIADTASTDSDSSLQQSESSDEDESERASHHSQEQLQHPPDGDFGDGASVCDIGDTGSMGGHHLDQQQFDSMADSEDDSGVEEDEEEGGEGNGADDIFDEEELERELEEMVNGGLRLYEDEEEDHEDPEEEVPEHPMQQDHANPQTQSRHGQDFFDSLAGTHYPGQRPASPPNPETSPLAFKERLTPSEIASVRILRTSLRTNATKAQLKGFRKDMEATVPGLVLYGEAKSTTLIKTLTRLREHKWDMCPNSCMAFVGRHAEKTRCTSRRNGQRCNEARYDASGKPRRQYTTFSILPRVRAKFASGHGSTYLHDLAEFSDRTWGTDQHHFCDWSSGAIHRELREKGLFDDPRHDAYILSTDGAQFIDKRTSNGWVVILSSLNSSPGQRFLRPQTFIATVIPGPNNPVDLDSFLFPILQQFARAARGHWVWDGLRREWFLWKAWIVAAAADQQGSSKINHMTGPTGFCGCKSCHMEANYAYDGQTVGYFPLKTVPGSRRARHRPEYDPFDLPLRTDESFAEDIEEVSGALTAVERREARRVTGVGARPLLCFSPAFSIPSFFPPDVFHLFGSNIPSQLWASLTTPEDGDPFSLSDEQQELFASVLETSKADLPSSFSSSAPRDPSKNSKAHYKMFEWSLVTYLYLPAFLYAVDAPLPVIKMLTDLQQGVRLAMSDRGLLAPDLYRMRNYFVDFIKAWERLYIRDQPHLLYRATISFHQLLHIADYFYAHGSPRNTSQARCEREVGLLKRMLRSQKQPFVGIINNLRQNEHLRLLDLLLDDAEAIPDVPDFALATRISQKHKAMTAGQRDAESNLIEVFQQRGAIPVPLPPFVRRGKVKLSDRTWIRGSRIESSGARKTSRFSADSGGEIVYGEALHFLSFGEQEPEHYAGDEDGEDDDEDGEVHARHAFIIFRRLGDIVAANGIIRGRWQDYYNIINVRAILEPVAIFELGGYVYVLRSLSWLLEQ